MLTMLPKKLYKGNDHTVDVTGLVDYDGAAVTGATGSWYLLSSDGLTQLATGAMSNPSANNYRGTVQSSDFSSQAVGTVVLVRVVLTSSGRDMDRTEARVVSYYPFSD